MQQDWYDKILSSSIIENKLSEWKELLEHNLTEKFYHDFLAKNAGLYLTKDNCHMAISKLKLGSEFETDFVTITDNFSNGNLIELIEIKQPSAKLFTDKGISTAELNRACQQIRDWKRWLIDNKTWFSKYLPTLTTRVVHGSNLKFKIIIGRRINNPYEIEKRNQISDEIGVEIRSFDYLTDKLKTRSFQNMAWTSDAIQKCEKELANPFFRAFTDSQWKKFCNSKKVGTFHFYSKHYEDIIKLRNENI